MITASVPNNWRQLQSEVGRVLGFKVEVEKKVETAVSFGESIIQQFRALRDHA